MSTEKFVDLHMHSTFSDGVHSPTALVDIAVGKKLVAISLSDHDSVDGFNELAEAAGPRGVELHDEARAGKRGGTKGLRS